jgi:hypothetical protein
MAALRVSRAQHKYHSDQFTPRSAAHEQSVLRHKLAIAAEALENALVGLAELSHALSAFTVPPHA